MCLYNILISSWTFVWNDQGTLHIRKHFINMLKSQIWQNSWSGESLLGDLVHTVYKIQKSFFLNHSSERSPLFQNDL